MIFLKEKETKKTNRNLKLLNQGFTLVELLAVIVVLAIVLIIAVPGVLSIINKTKNSAYDRQIDMIKDAAKNYVTANTIAWAGENPKSTVVTLDMLQSSGYLDKKILDPRDKKEILCANVLVSKDNKNKVTYDVDMACNDVQPITPRVGSGMIPIVYDGTNWRKADTSNKSFAWFNYGNQQWANVATVTEDVRQTLLDAPVDTIVPMDKINTMFTWIPRFKYKLFNVDGTVSPVGNKNLVEDYMIDIKFETASTTKSTGTQNGQWLTHPAFTFGGQELDGLWVGKFQTAHADATSKELSLVTEKNANKIVIKPNTYSWRGLTVSQMYYNSQEMKTDGNVFGITDVEDAHMMKNIEWGAPAYLTNSKYGKSGNPAYKNEPEVRVNNNISYQTGCGANSANEIGVTTCNSYETSQGQAASTTGNVSGIYDTSGGGWDTLAASMKSEDGTNVMTTYSGFTQEEINQIGTEGKYLDVYDYGTEFTDRSRGHLGDATIELGPFHDAFSSWYEDFGILVSSTNGYTWFVRGGSSQHQQNAGILAANTWSGGSGGTASDLLSRVVLK